MRGGVVGRGRPSWIICILVLGLIVVGCTLGGESSETGLAEDTDAEPDTAIDSDAEGNTEPAAGGNDEPDDLAPKAPEQNVIKFVYFVEAGETAREDVRFAIERHAADLQRSWYEQFGGTFRLNDPVVTVMNGEHDAAWYDTTEDGIHTDPRWYRLGNISTEVRSKLGTVNTRFVTYPATTITEPRVGVNFDGAWMDGDDALCILGETPSYPYPDGNDANCLGHVAHELGHVYGLEHEGPKEDCMQLGFYDANVMCRFSAENREAVRSDPANVGWLDIDLRIERDPDPAPASDTDEGNDQERPDPGDVVVIFENDGCRPVDVYWLNFRDELVPYGTVAPASGLAQSTFIQHEWVFQVDAQEVDRWIVAGAETYRIDSGGCD